MRSATNGAQPDWYLGWLIGALRLMPGFDVDARRLHPRAEPVLGRRLFPLVVLGVLVAFPWLERRITGDRGVHNVLDRPRDAPGRTAFGAAFLTWIGLIFVAGSADRATVFFGLDYATQIWVYRFAVWLVPVAVFLVVRRLCRDLRQAEEVERVRARAEAEARAAAEPAVVAAEEPPGRAG